jgi:hypothetical protein
MKGEAYICAECGGMFVKSRPDQEALDEKDCLFPSTPMDECALVCEECFQKIMRRNFDEEFYSSKASLQQNPSS